MSSRMAKVNQEIKKHIVAIIQEEIDDPHLGMVSITGVRTSSDLREAKIYFSVLDDNFEEVDRILNQMKKFIRYHLGRRIRLKFLPRISFVPDDSIRYSVEIYKKIEEVRDAEENNRSD